MTDPTDKQLEILEFMRAYQRQHSMPPTLREMALEFGVGINAIRDQLLLLFKKGHVTHRPGLSRGWVARQPEVA